MPKLVRAAVLTKYLEVTQNLGFNPCGITTVVGLSKAQLRVPENRIPIDSAVRLLEDSASPDRLRHVRPAHGRVAAAVGLRRGQPVADPPADPARCPAHHDEIPAICSTSCWRSTWRNGAGLVVIREEFVPDRRHGLATGHRTGARRPVPPVRRPAGPALEAA